MSNSSTAEKHTDAKKKLPTIKTRGRPAIDWESLYAEWVERTDDISPSDFITEYGLNPQDKQHMARIRMWVKDVIATEENLRNGMPTIRDAKGGFSPSYDLIRMWRRRQATADFRLAEKIRAHANMILDTALYLKEDDEGNQTVHTKMRPHELKHLTDVMEGLQKSQRLALGMSTENVGIAEDELEEDGKTKDGRVFVVEVNKNGKFIRPRPRQVESPKE